MMLYLSNAPLNYLYENAPILNINFKKTCLGINFNQERAIPQYQRVEKGDPYQ